MAKYTKFCFASDNHGDQADPDVLKVFWEFLKSWKPTVRIHGGDCWDYRWLRGRASDEEKREKIQQDFDEGLYFIGQYDPTHFLTGNHDYRVHKAAQSDDGKLSALAQRLIEDAKEALGDIPILPWGKRHGVLTLGGQRFIHGYHSGVNAVRDAARIYGNVCMGHIHAHDIASVPNIDRVVGHSTGSICRVDLDYNAGSPNTLRQSNGWIYGLMYPGGRTQVWHAEKIAGKWIMASDVREF